MTSRRRSRRPPRSPPLAGARARSGPTSPDPRRPGVIINLASGAPYRGSLRATAYMASKLGIVGLTRDMAREPAPHGIRVNAVAPGVTNTAMPRLGKTEEALMALGRTNPTGRLAEPDDIADVVVFLATDAARFVVGQLIHVNGGDY